MALPSPDSRSVPAGVGESELALGGTVCRLTGGLDDAVVEGAAGDGLGPAAPVVRPTPVVPAPSC